MRLAQYGKEVEYLLNNRYILSIEDIAEVCPGMPMPTVYSRVNKLLKEGRLSVAGRGKYVTAPKILYTVEVSPWMRNVNDYLNDKCIGVNHCLSERDGNLFVQVGSKLMATVLSALQKEFQKVLMIEDYKRFPLELDGYIVIDRLISESPVIDKDGVVVPSIEKMVVDSFSAEGNSIDGLQLQKAVEAYPVNLDSMLRYAARRGVKEEIGKMVSGLDYNRLEMFAKIQKYFSTSPIERAWVFGSFARGEETPSSDLDLLVDYAADSRLSLLDVIKIKKALESLTGREVDLVENGYLKPFAIPSAEKEKYLIYAR